MAKKIGKVLLCAAAVGSAVAAVCYFLRKREQQNITEEDDYDDFGDDLDEASDSSRSYVPLNSETTDSKSTEAQSGGDAPSQTASEETQKTDSFTPLTEQVAQTADKAEEAVEEFFDEDDDTDQEPPVNEN